MRINRIRPNSDHRSRGSRVPRELSIDRAGGIDSPRHPDPTTRCTDMASYAFLTGCSSREAAARYPRQESTASAPELEMKYMIPLFWLAAFDASDVSPVHYIESETVRRDFVVLCAPASEAVARLRRRTRGVTALIPQRFSSFYDDWIGFVEASYREHLLLDAQQLFAMSDDASSGERLIANLHAFAPAERGEAISDLAAFEWFGPLYGAFDRRSSSEPPAEIATRWRAILSGWGAAGGVRVWPPPPSATELDYARSCLTLPEPTPEPDAELTSNANSSVIPTAVSVGAVVIALLNAFAGIVFLPVGLYLGWRSLANKLDWNGVGVGLFIIAIGVFALAGAYQSCRFAQNARERLGR